MGLTKQAKILTGRQTAHLQSYLQQTRHPERNRVILLLSVKAGLRAKEIAALTWDMLTDAEGNLGYAIHLRNEATKGSSGRVIPMNRKLRKALEQLYQIRGSSPYVMTSERSEKTSAAVIVNLFAHWYARLQRLFESLRPTHLYHDCGSEDRECRRLNQGRSFSLGMRRSAPPSATSRRTWRRRERSWI
jgi:integrase